MKKEKPVQTSEFAYSKVLDEVKEKEVPPNNPGFKGTGPLIQGTGPLRSKGTREPTH